MIFEKIRSIFSSDAPATEKAKVKTNPILEQARRQQGNATVDEVSRASQTRGQVQQPNGSRPQNAPQFGIPNFTTLKNNKQLGAGLLPEYKIHVISQIRDYDNTPIRVSAYLPEQISVDISSNYKTPFDNSILGDNLAGNVLRAFGNSGIVQEMTFKVWDTTQGMTFEVPLVIVADDEYNGDSLENSDIMVPILRLCRLCTPSKVRGSKFLRPPGPSLTFTGADFTDSFANNLNEVETSDGFDAETGLLSSAWDSIGTVTSAFDAAIQGQLRLENSTAVYFGNFMTLPSVVVEGVSQQYNVVLDNKGKPLSAMVNLRFSTSMVPTIEDLYAMFGKSINNVPSNAVGQ